MSKAMKNNKLLKQNRKVTDFFSPKSSTGSSSSQPRLSQPGALNNTQSSKTCKKKNPPPREDQEVISVSSETTHITVSSDSVVLLTSPPPLTRSQAKSRAAIDAIDIPSPRRSRVAELKAPSGAPSLKRSRSPDIQFLASSQRPATKSGLEKHMSRPKRKNKFDDDSDIEIPDTVIYVASSRSSTLPVSKSNPENRISLGRRNSSKPSPPKKQRISSPVPAPAQSEPDAIVPSSQSDEHELHVPRTPQKDRGDIRESVKQWLNDTPGKEKSWTRPPSPHAADGYDGFTPAYFAMDVDLDSVPHISPPVKPQSDLKTYSPDTPSEELVSLQLPLDDVTMSGSSHRSPSSPPSSRPLSSASLFHPPSPAALDEAAKTAQVIAKIRAEAFSKRTPSVEKTLPLTELKALEDSSDDDDDLFWKGKGKVPSKPFTRGFDSPLTDLDSPGPSRLKVIPCPESPSPSTSRAYRDLRSRGTPDVPPGKVPVFATRTAAVAEDRNKGKAKAKAMIDPLVALLREKRREDKQGKGIVALRNAEGALIRSFKGEELEDGDEGAWHDEEAALRAVREGEESALKSPSPSRSGSDEPVMDAKSRERLLGSKEAKAVGKILESDRMKKGKGKAEDEGEEEEVGVTFWAVDANSEPHLSSELPPFTAGGRPILDMLCKAVESNDIVGVMMIVQSGAFTILDAPASIQVSKWLFEAVFSSVSELRQPAYQALLQLHTRSITIEPFVSFDLVLSALVALGAKIEVLRDMEWQEHKDVVLVDTLSRGESLWRLVTLISAFARAKVIQESELPDIVGSLLLVALDPSTSIELGRDITIAIEALGACDEDIVDRDLEGSICNRVLSFASKLTVVNQAHMLTFLPGGCPRMRRIAQYIAHNLLVQDSHTPTSYTELPPLSALINLLTPPGAKGIFEIQSNPDRTDYGKLGLRFEIFSKALMDVDAYAALEKSQPVSERSTSQDVEDSPKRSTVEKPRTPLEQLIYQLMAVRGKIDDLRAAYLDRSRAKAAIHRLENRIHYQRIAAIRARVNACNVSLDGWLARRS